MLSALISCACWKSPLLLMSHKHLLAPKGDPSAACSLAKCSVRRRNNLLKIHLLIQFSPWPLLKSARHVPNYHFEYRYSVAWTPVYQDWTHTETVMLFWTEFIPVIWFQKYFGIFRDSPHRERWAAFDILKGYTMQHWILKKKSYCPAHLHKRVNNVIN